MLEHIAARQVPSTLESHNIPVKQKFITIFSCPDLVTGDGLAYMTENIMASIEFPWELIIWIIKVPKAVLP